MTEKKRKLNWHAFPIALLVVVAYLLMGFLGSLWHPGWIIFLAIPLYHWIVRMVQDKKYSGLPTTISVIVSVAAYLLMGFLGGLWHPGWVVFFLVPVVSSFENFAKGGLRVRVRNMKKNLKESFGIEEDEDEDEEEETPSGSSGDIE